MPPIEFIRVHPWRPGSHHVSILEKIQTSDGIIYDESVPPELLLWAKPGARFIVYQKNRLKKVVQTLKKWKDYRWLFLSGSSAVPGFETDPSIDLKISHLSAFSLPGDCDRVILDGTGLNDPGTLYPFLQTIPLEKMVAFLPGDQIKKLQPINGRVRVYYARHHDWFLLSPGDRGKHLTSPLAVIIPEDSTFIPGYRGFRPRVVITRPWPEAWILSEALWQANYDAVPFPVIEFAPGRSAPSVFYRNPESFDWIVFTSPRGVDFFFHWLDHHEVDRDRLLDTRFAVIGPATGRRLEAWGIRKYSTPSSVYQAEGLVDFFRSVNPAGQRILIPRASGRPILVRALKDMGARVTEWLIYRTRPTPLRRLRPLKNLLLRADAVVFTSPSTYDHFSQGLKRLFRRSGIVEGIWARLKIIAIGPITAARVKEGGHHVTAIAPSATMDDLMRSIFEHV